ncbi:MAG: hypothetical protein Q8L84_09985 [Hyphomonas sp.]|nr:hypothetical protein [Hyphomonas sp.]
MVECLTALATLPRPVGLDDRVFETELVPMNAMGLSDLRAVALRVAACADRLDIEMMLRRVAEMMIVFMAALAFRPDVAAIHAGQRIRMRAPPRAHLDIDPLAGLHRVAVARAARRWTRPACLRVYAVSHALPPFGLMRVSSAIRAAPLDLAQLWRICASIRSEH